ncbi:MAG: tetratricopeptide repeat protein [Ornithinimicrobium sp.]|uniref:tetratricopeptide repeat protein n=1 Tax=Ornithinimicrobium sp. TaxID=1977084 RepID=UPI003D9AE9C3
MRRSAAQVSLGAGAVLLAGTLLIGPLLGPDGSSASPEPVAASAAPADDPLARSIAGLQDQLKEREDDDELWAQLGGAYVEAARVSADPSYYPKAQGALDKSLGLLKEGNDDALTALGALANARHEFAAGADWARQAQQVNPANSTSWGVLADSLVQLGDYEGSTAAVQQMLDLRPGLPAYTRASYDLELHGQRDRARQALELALRGAFSPADTAFCRYYLGQLAFTGGDLVEAGHQFQTGLEAVPNDPTLLAGQARVLAARGEQDQAVAAYERVVAARPLPDYLFEYATYLESLGLTEAADAQFSVLDAAQALFEANGVQDDLTSALVAAERGDPKAAVQHAQREWKLRHNVDAADAMAWALHSAGRNEQALGYAIKATKLEGPNATFLYHRGMIEAELGMDAEARTHLKAALATNPHFSPLHAPKARAALDRLGAGE